MQCCVAPILVIIWSQLIKMDLGVLHRPDQLQWFDQRTDMLWSALVRCSDVCTSALITTTITTATITIITVSTEMLWPLVSDQLYMHPNSDHYYYFWEALIGCRSYLARLATEIFLSWKLNASNLARLATEIFMKIKRINCRWSNTAAAPYLLHKSCINCPLKF